MQIYINRNGQQIGPFEEEKVRRMLESGELSAGDYGIRQGQQQWEKLESMFPQQAPVWTPPPAVSSPSLEQANLPTPPSAKSGSSKGIIFGVLGCGGLLLLGIVGIAAYLLLNQAKTTNVVSNTNVSNTNISNTNISDANVSASPQGTPDPYKEDSERKSKFEPLEDDFVKLPAKTQLTKDPYIKGKVAFYNNDLDIDDKEGVWLLDNDLAGSSSIDEKVKDLKAKTPEEVETVVLRNCKQYKKGDYIASGRRLPGYGWNCQISIIDRTIPALIYKKSFSSAPEVEVQIRSTDTKIESYIPYTEIATYISGLPRK